MGEGIDLQMMGSLSSAAAKLPAGQAVHMSRVLEGFSRSLNVTFKLSGGDISSSEVFSRDGLLLLIACIAQGAGQRLLEADFGCELRRSGANEPSMLGARCVVPPMTANIADITRALFFIHYASELLGMRENAVIEVQPILETLWPVFSQHVDSYADQDPERSVPWPPLSQQI